MGVIKEFFSAYTLPQARKHLKEMLEDTICNVEVYAINYIFLYDHIEKLIEAAWLIHQPKETTQSIIAVGEEASEALIAILQLIITSIRPEGIFLLSHEANRLIPAHHCLRCRQQTPLSL